MEVYNFLVFIFCICFSLTVSTPQQRKFPNIAFIGRGYDIYRSNPRPSSQRMDPGYVSPVIEANIYHEGRRSGDNQFLIPDRIDAVQCQACQQTFQFHQLKTAEDLKRTSGTTVTAGYEGVFFGAKSSSSHEEIEQSSYEYDHVYVDAYALCSSYCASIRQYQFNATDLTENFQSAVHELCIGELSPLQFLWTFGTHYITKIKMGSLFWQRTTFTSEDWADLQVTTKINTNTFRVGFRHQKTSGSKEEEWELETYTAKSLSRAVITFGTELDRTSTWLYVSDQQPMPTSFSIYPIISLLSRHAFPTELNLHVKRREIVEVLQNGTYCKFLLQIQGKDDEDCYGLTLKEVLSPANKIAYTPCPDIFGGHYSNNFEGVTEVNHLTKELKCPPDYVRKDLLSVDNDPRIVSYCISGETKTNFGGFYSEVATRNCKNMKKCTAQGIFFCYNWKYWQEINEGPSGMTSARGWKTNGNGVNGNSKSCPSGFSKIRLGRYYIGDTNCCDCSNEPVRNIKNSKSRTVFSSFLCFIQIYIDTFACYNNAGFVNGDSYVGGFYGDSNGSGDVNPSTGGRNCKETFDLEK